MSRHRVSWVKTDNGVSDADAQHLQTWLAQEKTGPAAPLADVTDHFLSGTAGGEQVAHLTAQVGGGRGGSGKTSAGLWLCHEAMESTIEVQQEKGADLG
eukprot:gene21102-31735_t